MSRPTDPFAPFVSGVAAGWPDGSPPWRIVDGSLVFSDVSGFTALSERLARRGKLGAEQMTELLDAVFERLLGAALARGGDLLSFGGDALFLLFDGPGHEARAAAAALELQQALRARTAAHAAVGRVSLGMSIGCHTGPVHLHRAGTTYSLLLPVGPTVSRVLTLEGAANRGEVLVSAEIAAALPDGCVGPLDRGGHLLLRPPETVPPWSGASRAAPVVPSTIPPRVRPHLVDGADAEHRYAVMCFVAAAGTDDLVTVEPPIAVNAALHRLVTRAQEITDEYGVTILDPDVYPDAIKFFLAAGVPDATPDDADRMLEAARQVAAIDTPLVLRAGVNGGRVFAGPVGARVRRAYTAMGDTVNLAARLMSHAPARTVLAADGLLDRARTHFHRTALEPFQVKGKAQPIRASLVGAPETGARPDVHVELPLVGRVHERAVLVDAWSAAASGTGAVVELVGEPGIGKSRLVDDLVSQVDAPPFVAEGGVYAATSPYQALIPPLLRIVDVAPDASEAEQGRTLLRFVERRTPDLVPWAPLLAIAFGIELPDTRETGELAPEFRRARLAEVFVEFLRLVSPTPTLFLLEDAHWLDEASQELVTTLARATTTMPWVVLVTRRPDPTGLVIPDDVAPTRLALEPLDATAAATLATFGTDEVALPAQTVAALVERSAGNPLFLTELIRAAAAGEDVDALPESMESLIAGAIDTLDPRDRRVLRQASVLGRRFPEELLRDLVGEAGLAPALDRLERFLERDAGRLRFRHALLRQTAYEGLPFRTRADLHLRAAEYLERSAGALADEESELLSLHFSEGRSHERAYRYSRLAADRARSDLAPVEAATFYRRALKATRSLGDVSGEERAALEESLADVEELAGHYELARGSLRRARRLVRGDPLAQARLLQKDGWIEARLGRLSQTLSLYARALRALQPVGGSEAAVMRRDLEIARASAKHRQGHYDECIDIVRAEVRTMPHDAPLATRARAEYLLHAALSDRMSPEAVDHAHRALRLYEEAGDLSGQSAVLNNLGVELSDRGDWVAANEHWERSADLARRIGDVVEAATATFNIAETLVDQGYLEAAELAFLEAQRVWRGAAYSFGIALGYLGLGMIRARTGDAAEAHRLFDAARAGMESVGARGYALQVDAHRIDLLLIEGRVDESLERVEETLRAADLADERALLEARLERVAGIALLRLGDPEGREHLAASLAAAEGAGADFERALALETIAGVDGTASAEAAAILSRLGVRETITTALLGEAATAAATPTPSA